MLAATLLREVRLLPERVPDPEAWPFTLPAVAALADGLELHPEVTCLGGENGSGKSTIAEAIAAKLDLDAEGGDTDMSHGESFLTLALERFLPDGIFVLDEPEAALSPQGCLSLLRRMRELALDGAQFVMATHSPLLLAYPGAAIYELSDRGIERVAYEETDHYRLTRAFLEDPQAFLRHLFS